MAIFDSKELRRKQLSTLTITILLAYSLYQKAIHVKTHKPTALDVQAKVSQAHQAG